MRLSKFFRNFFIYLVFTASVTFAARPVLASELNVCATEDNIRIATMLDHDSGIMRGWTEIKAGSCSLVSYRPTDHIGGHLAIQRWRENKWQFINPSRNSYIEHLREPDEKNFWVEETKGCVDDKNFEVKFTHWYLKSCPEGSKSYAYVIKLRIPDELSFTLSI